MYLHECIQELRHRYVEFVHRADQDMRQRMMQLASEVDAHKCKVVELRGLASTVNLRQSSLLDRSNRAMELHKNLSERVGESKGCLPTGLDLESFTG